MQRNFDFLEAELAKRGEHEPGQDGGPARGRHRHPRPPLEDPLDAQLRAVQRDAEPPGGRRAARQGRRRAPGPAPELGERPQLGQDRGPVGHEGGGRPSRPSCARRSAAGTAAGIVAALEGTERGRRFVAERIGPYQQEFGWHAVWSHEFIFPSFLEHMEPIVQLVKDQLAQDYDYPSSKAKLAADIRAAADELLAGLEGEALAEVEGRPRHQPADGAAHARPPLLHRPGRQRARPPGAARGRREAGRAGRPRRAPTT